MSVRISRHKNSVKIAKYKVKAGEIIDDSPSFLLGNTGTSLCLYGLAVSVASGERASAQIAIWAWFS